MPLFNFLTGVQQFLAFLCACLPAYRPLLPKKIHLPRAIQNWQLLFPTLILRGSESPASKTSSSASTAPHHRSWPRHNQYDNLDGSSDNAIAPHKVRIAASIPADRAGIDLPLNAIRVEHEVLIV